MHSSLELGMFFLEETTLSFGDKTISLLMFTPTVYVPQQLATRSGHGPGSRASGLKKGINFVIRSEIG